MRSEHHRAGPESLSCLPQQWLEPCDTVTCFPSPFRTLIRDYFPKKTFTPSHNASNLLKITRFCVNPSIFNHSRQGRARTRFHDGRECLVFLILHSCMSWQWAGNTPIMNVWMIFRGSKTRIYRVLRLWCSFTNPSQTLHIAPYGVAMFHRVNIPAPSVTHPFCHASYMAALHCSLCSIPSQHPKTSSSAQEIKKCMIFTAKSFVEK